jgi:16S rRNA (adenine1518-N6/adenine1519-N6)-dimethyltransferase
MGARPPYYAMNNAPSNSQSLLAQTKSLLHHFDLKARKSLGQHFLINSEVLNTVARAAELSPSDLVLEIGPGLGILTRELAYKAGWVLAIELDRYLVEMLKQTLGDLHNVSLVNADALDIEPSDLIEKEKGAFSAAVGHTQEYKLAANLPYYITSPILRHFCEAKLKPRLMVLMVQKEVAESIVAQPGQMSILSLSIQLYGKPEIVCYVPAEDFYPKPKVDSAVLKIVVYPAPAAGVKDEKGFFKIVRAGYCAPRKQIANSLSQGLDLPKSVVEDILLKAGIIHQRRAESLSLGEWACLQETFSKEGKLT